MSLIIDNDNVDLDLVVGLTLLVLGSLRSCLFHSDHKY